MNQLTFDDRLYSLTRIERESQTKHLSSVTSRIGPAIEDFILAYRGCLFSSADLHRHIEKVVGPVAPGSADRVLRDMRQRGVINYRVVNRSRSLYEVL